jgi:hypothetical protein
MHMFYTGPGGGYRGLLFVGVFRTRHCLRASYLHIMQFAPAIPTRGTKVPASPE